MIIINFEILILYVLQRPGNEVVTEYIDTCYMRFGNSSWQLRERRFLKQIEAVD
jgi:hypothetical protein